MNRKTKNIFLLVILLAVALTFLLFFLCTREPEKGKTETTDAPAGAGMPAQEENGMRQEEDTAEVKIKSAISEMSLEEKVGQLFFVRCPEENKIESIAEYHLGGYLLFARDFREKSREQVQEEIRAFQKEAEIPLLIGVDEEGGEVNRVSLYSQFRAVPFWAPQALYREGGFDLIRQDTEEKCDLLASLGINVNLAPVCDVSTDENSYMFSRTFGKGGEETADYVSVVVSEMKEKGMGSVLKHFPGYGNNQDTHSAISYDDRSYESFAASDFLPFTAGIEAGAGAVLVSHNIVKAMDAESPASLSEKVHEILRGELGFEGVIMTDDLSMEAIGQYTGKQEAAVKAILAGNDILCCTDFVIQIPAVIEAVKDGTIAEEQIDQAVYRVLLWKQDLGLL